MIQIDLEKAQVTVDEPGGRHTHALASPEAFRIVSDAWLRCGWDVKHVYSFSWLGRPIIQLPEDLVRIQETIYEVQPDLIIETGIAHGGSLVFYAGLCKAIGKGRVVGIDIEIRPHNRAAIDSHFLRPFITLLEGSSIDPVIVAQVRALARPGETVLVILDSCHTRAHVAAELEAYAPLVTVGSYLVATDGIMKDLAGAPRSKPEWTEDNPYRAAQEFATAHREFVAQPPVWPFNESNGLKEGPTYWPGAYLKRVR